MGQKLGRSVGDVLGIRTVIIKASKNSLGRQPVDMAQFAITQRYGDRESVNVM